MFHPSICCRLSFLLLSFVEVGFGVGFGVGVRRWEGRLGTREIMISSRGSASVTMKRPEILLTAPCDL